MTKNKLKPLVHGKNILFISFRLDSTSLDGVSLETNEWAKLLHTKGAHVHYYSGQTKPPAFVAKGFENKKCHFVGGVVEETPKRIFAEGEITKKAHQKIHSIKEEIKKDLNEKIIENKIDYLIAENILAFPGNIALSLAVVETANELDLPVIAHDHDFFWERERFKVQEGSQLEEILNNIIAGANNLSVAVINSPQKKELVKRFRMNAVVTPNVRDFSIPPKTNEKKIKEFKTEFKINGDEIFLLAPVRPVPRKNLELTIEVAAKLRKKIKKTIKILIPHPAGDEGLD